MRVHACVYCLIVLVHNSSACCCYCIQSCSGWRLNRLPEVRSFIFDDIPLLYLLPVIYLSAAAHVVVDRMYSKAIPEPHGPRGLRHCSPFLQPSARHQLMPQDQRYVASASRGMPLYSSAFAGTKIYCLVTGALHMGANNLPRVVMQPRPGRCPNSQPLDRKCDALRADNRSNITDSKTTT